MKKLLGVFFAILLLPVCANATTIDFYTDGWITDGNVFDTVNIWDSATVNMIGGVVGVLGSYDLSIFNLQNGSVVDIQLWDSAVAHISGGNISGTLGLNPMATANIYGKNFNFTFDGGATGWLTGNWADNTPFTIYCRGPSASYLNSHLILHVIPEPCTLGLIGFGFFILRRTIKPIRK